MCAAQPKSVKHASRLRESITAKAHGSQTRRRLAYARSGMPEQTLPSGTGPTRADLAALITSAYPELISLGRMLSASEPKRLQIDTEDLVQESLLRVLSTPSLFVCDTDHLVRIVYITMRRVIVDHARSFSSRKQREISFAQDMSRAPESESHDLLAKLDLREQLRQIARDDPLLAESLYHYYYGGLSTSRTAERLDRSQRSVQSDLYSARSRLRFVLQGPRENEDDLAH